MSDSNFESGSVLRLSRSLRAGALVVLVGIVAALAETRLVETRESPMAVQMTASAAEPAIDYFPAQFSLGDTKAEPHVDAF